MIWDSVSVCVGELGIVCVEERVYVSLCVGEGGSVYACVCRGRGGGCVCASPHFFSSTLFSFPPPISFHLIYSHFLLSFPISTAGKTLMSITIMWTLLNQGKIKGQPAVKKVVVACPTSLVGKKIS